jgi:hypothetical protein
VVLTLEWLRASHYEYGKKSVIFFDRVLPLASHVHMIGLNNDSFNHTLSPPSKRRAIFLPVIPAC